MIIVDIHPWRPYKNQHGWTLVACSGPKSWILYLSRSHQLFLLFCPPKLMLSAVIVSVVTLRFIVMLKHHASLSVRRNPLLFNRVISFFHFNILFNMASFYFRLWWGCTGTVWNHVHLQSAEYALALWCLLRSHSHIFERECGVSKICKVRTSITQNYL